MKKVSLILSLILTAFISTKAQTDASYIFIEIWANEINNSLPQEFGSGITYQSCTAQEYNMTMLFRLDNDLFSYDDIKGHESNFADSFVKGLGSTPEAAELINIMAEHDGKFIFSLYFVKEGKTLNAEFTAKEVLNKINTIDTPITAKSDPVVMMVNIMNEKTYPLSLGMGMTMEKIQIEGKKVMYKMTIDNTLMTSSICDQEMADNCFKGAVDDPTFSAFLHDVRDNDYSLFITFSFPKENVNKTYMVDYAKFLKGNSSTLDFVIAKVNGSLPKKVDDGIVWNKLRMDGDEVIYDYTIDNPNILDVLKSVDGSFIANGILTQIIDSDSDSGNTASMFRENKKDIRVNVFIPSLNKTFTEVRKYGTY